jgi:UDP-N-acetylmuramoyl-tripeptide--D-alanyl-D-alanine ligase
MPAFQPDILSRWTRGTWSGRPSAATGFSVDSRRLSPGQAFVALKTGRRDGHDFLAAAAESGASFAIVSRPVAGTGLPQLVVADPLAALQAVAREQRRRFSGTVFAVTGSAGKTSTKDVLALLLGGSAGGVLATEGNLNNHIGVALTLTRLDPELHRWAVVEAGISAPGEMGTLAAMIEPDVVLVTMVGPAHLEELGSLEGIAREKAMLAGALRPGGICIFPKSCEAYPAFGSLPEHSRLVVENVSRLDGREPPPGRCRFSMSHSDESTALTVVVDEDPPLVVALGRVSEGMAQNVALAVCAAMRAGIKREEIRLRLRTWHPAPLRGEWKVVDGMRLYLDCYNANPASMADALSAFTAVAPAAEPRFFILGCMEELGADAPRFHAELGRSLALRPGDRALVIGGLADEVRRGALERGSDPAQVETADTVDAVAPRLAGFRGSVFVKGSRRHELERAFAGAALPEVSHA